MTHDEFIIEQLLKSRKLKSKGQRILDRIKAPKPPQEPEFKSEAFLLQQQARHGN